MTYSFFSELLSKRFNSDAVLNLQTNPNSKVLIISDFHMGKGKHDDFRNNGEMVRRILEDYYFKNGWYLVLNGDIEELAKYSLSGIRTEWEAMYRVFDLFATTGRLYKTLGNHDEDLVFEKDYPYPLYNAVRIETGIIPLYVYHGHQSSRMYTDFNNVISLGLRYLLKPIGIRNISSARSPRRSFQVEQAAYNFSLANNFVTFGNDKNCIFVGI